MQISSYQLGIIWAIGCYTDGRMVLRHKNKYFLEQLQPLFQNKNEIYSQISKDNTQYILKSTKFYIDYLQKLGWESRFSKNRSIPILEDYTDFLRGYIECHGTFDYCTAYSSKKKYYRLRFRLYGNLFLIEQIENILNRDFGLAPKKIQTLQNKKSGYIAYTNLGELHKIMRTFEGEPCLKSFWSRANEKLKNPRRGTSN